MKVKLIAVDMDGTFLRPDMTYDRPRFQRQYAQLVASGIKFVVASGNQYYQLKSFFPEIAADIAFVAENGAYVVKEGQELFVGEFTAETVTQVLSKLAAFPEIRFVVCGKNSAYIHRDFSDEYFMTMSQHYHRLQWVERFADIDDTIFKFALNLSDNKATDLADGSLQAFVETLDKTLNGLVKPVASGFESIDLIIPGLHKANGLQMLQAQWGIENGEVLALGDGGNDVEMLAQAGYGFAMDNAHDKIKRVAQYRADANDQDGVLKVIDQVLQHLPPFA